MKISFNWLKDYVSFEQSPEEIAELLTLAGLEVEEIQQIGSRLDGVVVGEVLECTQHPNADRLTVCKVTTGDEPVQIICGAPNVAVGQKVAVATVGCTLPMELPDGSQLTIKKSKIRGEVSMGMICAEDELGLGNDHSGIMVLDNNLKVGTPIADVLPINVDFVFEIGLTPNRPDASCHVGVARDLSAVLNKPLKKPFKATSDGFNISDTSDFVDISITDTDKCHRYVGILVKDVTVAESPDWLKNRLKAIGLRPINNVVDATNYVLHELGQPLHAFDYELLAGKKIEVKSYSENVVFTTLDETERKVPAGSLFICDGEKPVALAGIMGGLNTEINPDTKNVLIESAYFEPVGIRKTSKTLMLQSDSSYRFERGVDPAITWAAAYRCAQIISDIAGGQIIEPHLDVHPVKTEPRIITLRLPRLNHILGTSLSLNQALSTLRSLEFDVRKKGEAEMTCVVPTFRPDVSEEIDLIEEVARIYDYNKIPSLDTIQIPRPEILPARETFLRRIREIARSLDYREIYANSLLPESQAKDFADQNSFIRTLNPISKDTAILRPSLIPGLLKAAAFNFNRGAKNVRFFEIGNIFKKEEPGTYHKDVLEETWILLGAGGFAKEEFWSHGQEAYTFFDIKGSVEILIKSLRVDHLITSAKVSDGELAYYAGGKVVGRVLEIPTEQKRSYDIEMPIFAATFSINHLLELCTSLPAQIYKPVPKFPGIDFDMALLVDSAIDAGDMEAVIRETAGSRLKSISVFDVFEGKSLGDGKKSIGYRMRFIDEMKTLTIKDVDGIISKVVKKLDISFNAKLRN
jgi:phenylalanyl-tRNA synthetase beta chain